MAIDHAVPVVAAPAAGTRTVVVGLFLVALLPLFATPVLPFIDLYNHLARYFVLSHLDAIPLLRQNYAANWSILPNIGLDVIGTLVLRVLPPAFAAHVTVIAIFALQYGGVLFFNRQLAGRTSPLVALLLVPLLYSFILNWGFANFLFGLGLVFWAAGWWLARRDRLAVALPVACVLAVVIFLTHGLAFALYGVLLAALELGLFLARRPRPPTALLRALLPVLAQAVVPVVLFRLAATSQSQAGLTNADESVARLAETGALSARLWELFQYRLTTIVRVEEGPALWFDALTFTVQLGVVAALLWRGRLRLARVAWPALVVAALLVALVPPAMFGVGYVADRMPLFMALLVVGSLVPRLRGDGFERTCIGVLAAVVAVRLVVIAAGWQAYARDYAEFEDVAARLPRGALVADAISSGNHHDDAARCQMYRPLLVSLHGAVAPLFANETQQPLRLVGPLRRALDDLSQRIDWKNARVDSYAQIATAAGPAGFGYLFVCHAVPDARPLPAGSELVVRTARFTLIRVGRGATA